MDFPWIATIAAVVGSSGLIGGLTLAVQHSRAARLRRSVRESLALANEFGGGGRPSHALRAAATIDAYRLASMSLMQLSGIVISKMIGLLLVIVAGLVVAAFLLERQFGEKWNALGAPLWLLITAYGLLYVASLVWVLDQGIRRRRDKLVERLMADGEFAITFEDGRSRIVERDGSMWAERQDTTPRAARAAGTKPGNGLTASVDR